MTYNGWSNYETWNVALWLDNDEGSYLHVREMAKNAREDHSGEGLERIALAGAIEEMVKEAAPDLDASMYSDLLNAALSEVDWREIAEHILGES